MRQIIRFLLKVVLLPFRIVSYLFLRVLGKVAAPVVARIDASSFLSNWINQISSSMATQRGMLLMIGTGMLVVSLVANALVVVIMVATKSFDRTLYWLCIPFGLMHIGVLLGFTGTMLATPLGQGYKDNK